MDIKIKKLNENAKIPTYAHIGDAGMDITAINREYDKENDVYIYHTGLAFEVPKGYVMLLFPRSSNRKTDSYLSNSVGILDSTYRGELLVCYKNRTAKNIYKYLDNLTDYIGDVERVSLQDDCSKVLNNICSGSSIDADYYNINRTNILPMAPYEVGDRIAQIMILPYPEIKFEEVEELSDTERGDGGFGSTGK